MYSIFLLNGIVIRVKADAVNAFGDTIRFVKIKNETTADLVAEFQPKNIGGYCKDDAIDTIRWGRENN